ncbi:alpha/beta fold hydrolase [Alteromonas gracilis]|uniref:alpha/beta fold hydrolase n=1 Tax=Alteromonas gracilis TaxID=1479524 RepID=UPI003D65FD35
MPVLAEAGFNVLVPDLIGFGRSDKPTRREDYTYARHVIWVKEWFNQVVKGPVTLFCQDWGDCLAFDLWQTCPNVLLALWYRTRASRRGIKHQVTLSLNGAAFPRTFLYFQHQASYKAQPLPSYRNRHKTPTMRPFLTKSTKQELAFSPSWCQQALTTLKRRQTETLGKV